jgi:hypothetical protein
MKRKIETEIRRRMAVEAKRAAQKRAKRIPASSAPPDSRAAVRPSSVAGKAT